MPKGPKGEKRPAVAIARAVKVMRIATGEETEELTDDGKDKAAQSMGRRGGKARAIEDLAKLCEDRFGKRMHPWSLGRMLKKLGLSRQKSRPLHPQTDPAAQAVFKKTRPPTAIDPSLNKKTRAAVLPG